MNKAIHDPINIFIGMRIREARTEIGMTQAYLAEKLGISFQQLQKYEKAQDNISAAKLYNISVIIGKPVDYFCNRANPESPIIKYEGGRNNLRLIHSLTQAPLELMQYKAFMTLLKAILKTNKEDDDDTIN